MLPDWILTVASWCVVIGGLAVVVLLAVGVVWFAVLSIPRAIDAHFRADARRGVRYLLWHVQRVARRPETKLDLVPPEVERWARERVRSVLEAKAARKARNKE